MRPKKPKKGDHDDLFLVRLDQLINLRHELVRLAERIDRDWIDGELAPCFSQTGRPAEPVRFMIAMFVLKHTYGLSDEQVWDRWVYDPYFQSFTGEEFFQHALPHERSGLSHWRKRLGDKLELLLAESLRIAHDTGALRKDDLARVTVDTTVQPKNITFPTDAKLLETAIQQLAKLARQHDVALRQSYYTRLAKRAAVMAGRYAHAKALPGNPYDGHSLREVIEETEALTGREVERVYVDKGYRGHDAAKPLRVFKSGQRRGVHGQIKREQRRRSAIEAVIGHCKTDGHLGRNYPKGRLGDQVNAITSAVGYNFRLILRWLRLLWRQIIAAIMAATTPISALKTASQRSTS